MRYSTLQHTKQRTHSDILHTHVSTATATENERRQAEVTWKFSDAALEKSTVWDSGMPEGVYVRVMCDCRHLRATGTLWNRARVTESSSEGVWKLVNIENSPKRMYVRVTCECCHLRRWKVRESASRRARAVHLCCFNIRLFCYAPTTTLQTYTCVAEMCECAHFAFVFPSHTCDANYAK